MLFACARRRLAEQLVAGWQSGEFGLDRSFYYQAAEKGLPRPASLLCNLPSGVGGSQFYRRVRQDFS
jgi:hypothetical protein